MITIIIAIAASVAAVILFVYIIILKAQIRKAGRGIQLNKDTYYNRQITIELIDKDLNELISNFNSNLDYQKKLKFEAEQSENRLKQSISNIAHDLRTPITVIKGNLQLLTKINGMSDDERAHLKICMEKINVLGAMIDEFYEMSYYESEDVGVVLETVDANEFLAAFLIENESLIKERDIEPKIKMPNYSVFIKADKNMLQRMLANLLTNALRHGQKQLCISLGADDKNVVFEFENEADDIQNINIDRIFERTYRKDAARTGGGPGGLGLYIVKVLAGKQGAEAFGKINDGNIIIGIKFERRSK